MLEFIAILKTISAICGACVTIIGFISLILKKPKKWISDMAQKECEIKSKELKKYINEKVQKTNQKHDEDISEIKNGINEIKSKLNDKDRTDLATLRHEITTIYFEYKDKKKIPTYVKQDWLSLYESYIASGGNSYIKTITQTMENEWEEE